jgi:hypothetical protein
MLSPRISTDTSSLVLLMASTTTNQTIRRHNNNNNNNKRAGALVSCSCVDEPSLVATPVTGRSTGAEMKSRRKIEPAMTKEIAVMPVFARIMGSRWRCRHHNYTAHSMACAHPLAGSVDSGLPSGSRSDGTRLDDSLLWVSYLLIGDNDLIPRPPAYCA